MPSAPAFWYAPAPGVCAYALWPLSMIYRAVSFTQGWLRGLKPYYPAVPLISVGNLSVGGSGKTPLVEALARYYAAEGHAVAVVSKGYGAREARWPVRVDAFSHTARQVGDEALMLATQLRNASVAVWVAANKRDAVRRAEAAGATLIILDDGFHRHDIARNADVVVIDGPRGFGNGFMLPAGPLREPAGGLARASFAVVMDESADRSNQWYGATAYRLKLMPQRSVIEALRPQSLVAFAGLGNPAKFFDMLETLGLNVVEAVPFADHHAYTAADLNDLSELAQRLNAALVTTAKDAAKLPAGFAEVVDVVPTGSDWPGLLADLNPRLQS
ncbi:MAG TPA: tetraacyldisaccharide 4'-kinase [Alphaproteobacteria bacterium]|nr:tetraacyldisaccharide 4'-kinase [Alphaproteobacteria bacterium]